MGRVSDSRERLIEATIDLIRRESMSGVTVDKICELAQVKKGSFYHFFESKDELVVAALDAHWQKRKPVLDQLYSPSVAPVERLRGYFADVHQKQLELRHKYGGFVGCLFSSVGAGVSETSPEIRAKVQEILGTYERYYESALREMQVPEPSAKAKSLFAFMEGVLGQARIHDDIQLIKRLGDDAFRFLGIEEGRPVRAARGR